MASAARSPQLSPGEVEAQLAESKERIITHMNEDHGISMLAYCLHYQKIDGVQKAEMTDLTAEAFHIRAHLANNGGVVDFAVPFKSPMKSAGDARMKAVELHDEAYAGLGWKNQRKEAEAAGHGAHGNTGHGAPSLAPASLAADLEKSKARITEHLNADHTDSLKAYALHFGNLQGNVQKAEIVDITTDAFHVKALMDNGTSTTVKVAYPQVMRSPMDARALAVQLHDMAYGALGWKNFRLDPSAAAAAHGAHGESPHGAHAAKL